MDNFQLFREVPPTKFIEQVLAIYGIRDYNENYKFSVKDLINNRTVEKLEKLDDGFKKYYMKCKYKRFYEDLNEKKALTVLRHYLRPIGYKLISREKYSDGKKYLVYNIIDIKEKTERSLIVSFD